MGLEAGGDGNNNVLPENRSSHFRPKLFSSPVRPKKYPRGYIHFQQTTLGFPWRTFFFVMTILLLGPQVSVNLEELCRVPPHVSDY